MTSNFLKVNPPKTRPFPIKIIFAPGFKLASYKSDVTETASACEDKLFLFESENYEQ